MGELFYQVRKENKNLFYKLYIHRIGPFRFNWHKEIEINIILKGKVEVCVEGKKYSLEEDDIIIINSNIGHATLSKDPDSMAMVFHLDPIYFKEYFKEYESLRFEDAVISSEGNNEKYKIIRYLLASLLEEHKNNSEKSKIISDAIFSLVIVNLIETFPPTMEKTDKVKNSKSQREVIAKVLCYIEEMYKEKISLNKIADMLGYNPSYVSQFFKINIGINFYEYLTRVRIREATIELAKTDYSIADIALSHGFSDVKSFNKGFKESFGRSPNQYRAEIKDRNPFKQFPMKRIFVSDDDAVVDSKIKEYLTQLQNNPFFKNKIDTEKRDIIQEERSIDKYRNRIKELERNIEELNQKIELMRSILQ